MKHNAQWKKKQRHLNLSQALGWNKESYVDVIAIVWIEDDLHAGIQKESQLCHNQSKPD